MNEKTKESKFLDAINRYAEQQKAQINQEIEDYKNTKIEQATEQGLKDAYELIRDEVAARKAQITNDSAARELQLRNNLYAERESISEQVFKEARERLIAYSESDEYDSFIEASLAEIAALFDGESCKVLVAPKDEKRKEQILSHLQNAEFVTDPKIGIGGIKAYCASKGILADDTLDTRLSEQKQWFVENAGLKVV